MNWIKIEEKCPKAFDILNIWVCKEFGCDKIIATPQNYLLKIYPKNEIHYFFERRLFDFFDEQGIYIKTYRNPTSSIGNCFTYGIDSYDDGKYSGYKGLCGSRTTRTEAEEKAFEKAFEILEEKSKK